MREHYRRDWRAFDWALVVLVAVLCGFGVLMIYSATGMASGQPVTAAAAKAYRSQFMWVGTGFAVLAVFAVVDYEWIGKFWLALYGLNLALLVLVLVLGKGEDYARWLTLEDFGLPFGFGIQPSEFTKLFMVLYLAKFLERFRDSVNNPLVLLLTLAMSLLPVVLIAVQPSLSASLVPLVILAAMLFVAKLHYRYVIIAVVILAPLLAFLYYDLNREEHLLIDKVFSEKQISRVTAMMYPEENEGNRYQTDQSMAAIASGGVWGKGLFKNTIYVPYAYNDFIVSIVGAELGFAGLLALLAVMLAIIGKIIITAYRAVTMFGKLICAGVAAMFAFQAYVNVSVATGALPNTGMVFPFISSGGSSMWINMAAVGLVLSVGMKKKKSMFE